MNNVNYAKLCEAELDREGSREKTLLLQCCCAPCSSWCLTYLKDKIKIKALYYNPNILDRAEYDLREEELKRLVDILSKEYPEASIEFISGDRDYERYLEAVRGLENEPEGGKRCEKCFELRLAYTQKKAKEMGADYFSTTLTISPLKDAGKINEIGERLEKETGVKFLNSDFKKHDGYKKSVELSKKYNLYRQDYCGCPFSKKEREEENNRKANDKRTDK